MDRLKGLIMIGDGVSIYVTVWKLQNFSVTQTLFEIHAYVHMYITNMISHKI